MRNNLLSVKGTLYTILGLALPLLLMIALWWALNPPSPLPSAPPAANTPPANIVVAQTRPTAQQAELKSWLGEPDNKPTHAFGPPAAVAETVEDYVARWQDTVQRDPTLQQAAATTLLQQKQYAQAAEAFDRMLVRRSDDATLLTGKAIALTGLGRHDDALVILDNVARNAPNDVTSQFNYAVALMRTPDRSAAIRALERVLQLEPRHVRVLYNLAVMYQLANRPADALARWQELTDLADSAKTELPLSLRIDAWSHCGELLLELKQPADAEKCFANLVELTPSSAQAWCNLGIARAEQVRRDDAIAALKTALQLDPNLVPALNQIAYIEAANYRDTGNLASGRTVAECCRRSLDINPNQPNLRGLQQALSKFDPTDGDAQSPKQ